MRALPVATLVVALAVSGCVQLGRAAQPPEAFAVAGDEDYTFPHDGAIRTYRIHSPPQAVAGKPLPLLVMLHAGGDSGQKFQARTHMDDFADQFGFYVAYPDGLDVADGVEFRTWNALVCCGKAHRLSMDDVDFLASLVKHLKRTLPIDATRIGVAGHSNGAMMAYRVAAERSDLFTSVMSVAGAVGGQERPLDPVRVINEPARPVSVLILHARDDDHVPYEGGHGRDALEATRIDLSVPYALSFWQQANQVPANPTGVDELGDVHRETYANDATAIHLYATQGGHGWPGGVSEMFGTITAPPEPDASYVIATFLMEHPRPLS